MADQLSEILDGEIETLATGFVFTEGPVWHPDGFLYFSDLRTCKLHTWTPGKGVSTFRENDGEANGNTLDIQGRLLTCEMGNRRVTRTELEGTLDGATRVLADRWQGKRLNRTNDVVCRSDGLVYFTDPGMRTPKAERRLDFSGVFYISSGGQVNLGTHELPYPNGLAFSPDESILYVAVSRLDEGCIEEEEQGKVCTHRFIQAYDVARKGSLSNGRKFADMSSAEPGVPDGMKVDTEGHVFCTGNGGVCVFDTDGRQLGTIPTPEVTANCAFGGPDQKTLFLTSSTSLLSVRLKVPGVKPPAAG